MREDSQRTEESGAGFAAVVAVLAPVLAGTAAVIFLLTGYLLKMVKPATPVADDLIVGGWFFGALTAAAIAVAAAGLFLTALRNVGTRGDANSSARPDLVQRDVSARALSAASAIAGRRRAHLREEWAAILAGDPDQGVVLSRKRRTRYAVGFLLAAVRLRIHDLTGPLWLPVDWILTTESRTNSCIAAVIGAQAVFIVGTGGIPALITEVWEPCGILGGCLYVLARWLRRRRGIELAAAPSDGNDQ